MGKVMTALAELRNYLGTSSKLSAVRFLKNLSFLFNVVNFFYKYSFSVLKYCCFLLIQDKQLERKFLKMLIILNLGVRNV